MSPWVDPPEKRCHLYGQRFGKHRIDVVNSRRSPRARQLQVPDEVPSQAPLGETLDARTMLDLIERLDPGDDRINEPHYRFTYSRRFRGSFAAPSHLYVQSRSNGKGVGQIVDLFKSDSGTPDAPEVRSP